MFVCPSNATKSSRTFARPSRPGFVAIATCAVLTTTTILTTTGCGSPTTETTTDPLVTSEPSGSVSNATTAPTSGSTTAGASAAPSATGVDQTSTGATGAVTTSAGTSSAPSSSGASTAPSSDSSVSGETTAAQSTSAETSGSSDSKDHGGDNHDHCVKGYEPELIDSQIKPGFAEYTENGQTDAVLQPEIIAWMEKKEWQEVHFQWHNVRRCGGGGGFGGGFAGGGGGGSSFNPCEIPALLPDANECENAQDGYEFLVMHRHMIQALKQLFPSHADQFEGWDKWPSATDYPELLRPYFTDWSQDVRKNADILDNIEDHLDMFANEGELGMWFQCGGLNGGVGLNSLHGALHFNGYPQQNQSHSVANQKRNLDSFIFWKLHGYMDKVWERYRVAKGLPPDEEALQTELRAQCMEMDALAHYIPGGEETEEPGELPNEAGFFHETVRPALEEFGCATCHGAGEDAGLRLGYQVSSGEIVRRLVNVNSAYASGYKLVVPGDPDKSWLYLKASGGSVTSGASCQGVMNCTQGMPPGGGKKLSDTALANLRKWIADGAPAPTEVP